MQSSARLRAAAVLLACAYAVHSLRYLLAYGASAPAALHHQGHAYLSAAPIVLTALLSLALAELVRRAAGPPVVVPGERTSLRRCWSACAVALLVIFSLQELAEGIASSGHPDGVQAIVGGGGWLAAPLCAAFGAIAALLLRAARSALASSPRRIRLGGLRPAALETCCLASTLGARHGAAPRRRGRAPPALAG